MPNRLFLSGEFPTKSTLFLGLCFLLCITSCRNSDRDNDTAVEYTKSFWSNTNKVHHVLRQIHGVALVDSVVNGNMVDTITSTVCFDSLTYQHDNKFFPVYPNELQIHFSDTVVCANTPLHTGTIIANFSGPYEQVGTEIQVTFDKYTHEGVEITGELSMELYLNQFDSLAYNVTFNGLTFTDLNKAAYNKSYLSGTVQWVRWIGNNTPEADDDDFTISGIGNGTSYDGVVYTYVNNLPVLMFHDCNYSASGDYILSTANNSDRICNFGDGSCDNKMLVTIEPEVADIEVSIK